MSYDFGDVVPLAVKVYDSTGALANATLVVLTITLPDGTTATPSVTNATTGNYTATYTPTLVGRHAVSWIATGTNASAYTDIFDVTDPADIGLIGLYDAKTLMQIPLTNTTYDDLLRLMIGAASSMWIRRVGPVTGNVTYSERYDGGHEQIILRQIPVLAITSVTETYGGVVTTLNQRQADSGSALTSTDYSYEARSGVLTRRNGGYVVPFLPGVANIHVTYTAGFATVPPDIQHAIYLLVSHMFETQRARMVLPGQPGADTWNPAMSFTWPKRVEEIASTYYQPGFA